MAMKFNKISEDVFKNIQAETGVLVYVFDPENPSINDDNIVCATSGGVNVKCVPSYEDYGADIDNCPENTKELTRIVGWDTSFGFTGLDITPDTIALSIGAATVDGKKVTPVNDLEEKHFNDIWWVGDITGGGFVAIRLMNALSEDGFSLQTTKKGKGKISVNLKGHFSIKDTSVVPMEFYCTQETTLSGETA